MADLQYLPLHIGLKQNQVFFNITHIFHGCEPFHESHQKGPRGPRRHLRQRWLEWGMLCLNSTPFADFGGLLWHLAAGVHLHGGRTAFFPTNPGGDAASSLDERLNSWLTRQWTSRQQPKPLEIKSCFSGKYVLGILLWLDCDSKASATLAVSCS